MNLTLSEIARAIDGTIKGEKVVATAPGHSRADRSMAVWPTYDDRLYSVHCLTEDWQTCRDYIDGKLGIDRRRPSPPPSPEELKRREQKRREAEIRQLRWEASRKEHARQQWRDATAPHGTIVDEYLARRGIVHLPASIRCLTGSLGMIAAVQGADGKIIAAQVTALTFHGAAEGRRGDRETIGKLLDGAVRLGPAGHVLGIAEGLETAMSAMAMTDVTTWATLGSDRMHDAWIPESVKELHLCVDNDDPGFKAARKTRELHEAAGRIVRIRRPPDECGDWNDFLNQIADRDGRDLDGGAA